MAMLNIPSTVDDPQYRYKMPRLVAKKEGRGNGSKTCIVNMGDVATALKRPPQYTTKWFGSELGAQVTYTNKDKEGERAIVNGHHDTSVFQSLLDKFIEKYVCCENCHLPEIFMNVKKGVIQGKCMACGWAGELDNVHRLAAFIQKNPPDESGHNLQTPDLGAGKNDKQAKREKRQKEREAAKNDEDDEDDEDEGELSPAEREVMSALEEEYGERLEKVMGIMDRGLAPDASEDDKERAEEYVDKTTELVEAVDASSATSAPKDAPDAEAEEEKAAEKEADEVVKKVAHGVGTIVDAVAPVATELLEAVFGDDEDEE